jgi:predicted RNA-binding Zn-ribbon protein involved in translation (DUF1610 family)
MFGHSPKRAKDTVGVALCPDCGFVGIISRAAEHDWGEVTYRCEECRLASERSAKLQTRAAARARARSAAGAGRKHGS